MFISTMPAQRRASRALPGITLEMPAESVRALLGGAARASGRCHGCGSSLTGRQRSACSARCRAVLVRRRRGVWLLDWSVRAHQVLAIV